MLRSLANRNSNRDVRYLLHSSSLSSSLTTRTERLYPLLASSSSSSFTFTNSHHRWQSSYTTSRGSKQSSSFSASSSPTSSLYQHQQIRGKVFVSKHNNLNVTKDVIFEYCHQQGISTQDAQAKSQHVVLKECPFCPKPTKGMATNLYKLYISIGGGAYMCHRCGQNGSWFDFKSELGGYQVVGGLGGTGAGTPSTNNPASTQHVHNTRGARGGGSSTPQNNTVAPLPMPQARLSACYSSLLLDAPGEGPQKANQNPSLQYLTETRGLTRATLRKYGVGRATYKFPDTNGAYQATECISFPWIMRASDVHEQETLRGSQFSVVDTTTRTAAAPPPTRPAPKDDATHKPPLGKDSSMSSSSSLLDTTAEASSSSEPPPTGKFVTRRIKVRALESKAFQRLDPPGGGWGLFGLHTVPDDATSIVLTEGEYDAMAVHQATGYPAVSLPNGCRSLPLQVLPLLERFEKVYLWMDNDGPGQEGAQQFTKKIGVSRTHLVQCRDAKDANDALLQGLNLKDMIDKASVTPHEQILTFADLRQEVLHEMMHPDKYTGVPVPSLPGFTKLIKGFRRGELTVLTGPTGSGKTTFLGQVSLDLAEQGINTLWGSFEIKNTRLMHKLLQQFSRAPLPKGQDCMEQLDALADRFEVLPLYFMKFHGGSQVDDVLDAMEYAVYVNDVEHIILDNMQFMLTRNIKGGSSWDKFEVQDIAIEKFRQFATKHNVHLSLVVHPRKEDETQKLNISSFYGSAKATQEADTVIILQNDGRRKYLEVKKNRFDGTLGYAPLHFHRESGRYVEEENGTAAKIEFKPPQPKQSFQYAADAKAKAQETVEVSDNFWEECLTGVPERA